MAKEKINFEDEDVRLRYRHTTSHIMICSIVINKVMMAGSGDTQVMIISNEFDKIQDKLNEMIIGVTVLYGRTGYLGKDQEVLMCIVPGRELNRVKEAIQLIDPKAFMFLNTAPLAVVLYVSATESIFCIIRK